ncbi:hypothetical protein [Wenxinia saemankumensis]|uniref:Flagellar motor switch protein FliM n=1 Tax=Wenxinia saemankumensis TaxID=1447782 RepID=A0A1M6HID5_9RHOB|nr:hypothetical protein [Wenxinia saemankumensis]SHJ21957.1 hypothetical protein SAMN05444417_3245 [Wenxinia saemankumensis]
MGEGAGDILRRIAGMSRPVDAPDPPVSVPRWLRRSAARAGQGIGLPLAVSAIRDGTDALDALLAALDEDIVLIGLEGEAGLRGYAVVDLDLRDALVEVQTLGQLPTGGSGGAGRRVTAADVTLTEPFLQALLVELGRAPAGLGLAEWVAGTRTGEQLGGRRAIASTLQAGPYRTIGLSLDLGTAGRSGTLALVLPPAGAALDRGGDPADWARAFRGAVHEAPATLTAILARLTLPLARAEGLKVGQVLALPGIGVGSVQLESAPGCRFAPARLGQVAGLRAVRLQPPDAPEMGGPDLGRPRLGGGCSGGGPDRDDPFGPGRGPVWEHEARPSPAQEGEEGTDGPCDVPPEPGAGPGPEGADLLPEPVPPGVPAPGDDPPPGQPAWPGDAHAGGDVPLPEGQGITAGPPGDPGTGAAGSWAGDGDGPASGTVDPPPVPEDVAREDGAPMAPGPEPEGPPDRSVAEMPPTGGTVTPGPGLPGESGPDPDRSDGPDPDGPPQDHAPSADRPTDTPSAGAIDDQHSARDRTLAQARMAEAVAGALSPGARARPGTDSARPFALAAAGPADEGGEDEEFRAGMAADLDPNDLRIEEPET